MFRSTALALLLMIHGTDAACDETRAKELISHMDQFNVMLGSFANLGSSAIAASSSKHANAHATGHAKRDVSSHAHTSPTHSQVHSVPTGTAAAAHHDDPDAKLRKQIRSTFRDLNKKQQKLDSYSDACIPLQHKLHLASQMTNMVSMYVTKDKEIKAAGAHLSQKKSKSKRSPEERAQRREEKRLRRREIVRRSLEREKHAQQPAQAAWLTMDDAINGGYNGQVDQLTKATTTSSSIVDTTSQAYYAPYAYNSPQMQPQYVTITSSGSIQITPTAAPPAASKKGKVNAASNNNAQSDTESSGSESESSSGDETTTSPANNAPLPTPSSSHRGGISGLLGGIGHLFSGTLHFIENIFSHIFIVDDLVQSGSSSGQKQQVIANSKEINQLLSHAKQLYGVK